MEHKWRIVRWMCAPLVLHAQWMLISLQKLYLAFVSNCKFTSAKTLPQIRFMENCLVELLSIDPATSYQHGFVYIRQLAVHLRTALTSAKKQAVQVEHKHLAIVFITNLMITMLSMKHHTLGVQYCTIFSPGCV